MADVRTCGHCGCEHYRHNYFSDGVLPNGKCTYSDKEIRVRPGDNCKFGLLEQHAQKASKTAQIS